MNDINGFTFYRNYYEIIKCLNGKDKLQLYDAIMEYIFEDKEPELKQLLNGIWVNLKMPLDNSKKNINNGKKGGRPKTQTITQTKPKRNPKHNPNETERQTQTKANNISYFLFLISNNKYKYIHKDSDIYNKIIEWLEYKEERKEKYKETGLNSLLTQIEKQLDVYGEKEVIDLINDCMANNYKGIIFDKLKNKKSVRQELLPNWYGKDIQKEELSDEEQQELQNILTNF